MDAARTTRPVASLVPVGPVLGRYHFLGGLLVSQGLGGVAQVARLCATDPATYRVDRYLHLFHGFAKAKRTSRCAILQSCSHGRYEFEHDHAA